MIRRFKKNERKDFSFPPFLFVLLFCFLNRIFILVAGLQAAIALAYRFVEALPRNAMGKVLKKELLTWS